MFLKSLKLYALSIAVLGIVIGALIAAPISYAGGAVTLVPTDDKDVPEGSYISEQRIKKIENEVNTFKANMKEKAEKKQQDQSQHDKSPKPESIEEK